MVWDPWNWISTLIAIDWESMVTQDECFCQRACWKSDTLEDGFVPFGAYWENQCAEWGITALSANFSHTLGAMGLRLSHRSKGDSLWSPRVHRDTWCPVTPFWKSRVQISSLETDALLSWDYNSRSSCLSFPGSSEVLPALPARPLPTFFGQVLTQWNRTGLCLLCEVKCPHSRGTMQKTQKDHNCCPFQALWPLLRKLC